MLSFYLHRFAGYLVAVLAAACFSDVELHAQEFTPGEAIEYKVRGEYPERWERGVLVREIDGGSTRQFLIREKPSQFFPEGFEIAFAVSNLRKLSTNARPQMPKGVNPAAPLLPNSGSPKNNQFLPAEGAGQFTGPGAGGLLSKEEIRSYAARLFGGGDPFANPQREALLNHLRDYIKQRGTNFQPDLDFSNQMLALGAYSVHMGYAITANYGPAPQVKSYFGTFLLRAANRGSQSVAKQGGRTVVTTEDSQAESGELTIHADGTYLWKPFRNDPPNQWLQGRWREVKDSEKPAWEGGPAIWLERAKQGHDYMVRASREPGYAGWIDVGMGVGRTPVEYGRPK